MQFSRKNTKRSFLIIENGNFWVFFRKNWVYKFSHWKGGGVGGSSALMLLYRDK
jgi:hypothetical protein